MPLPPLSDAPRWLAALAIGALGGLACSLIGAPLPWLLGGMAATGAAAVAGLRPFGVAPDFPERFRVVFIPVIGVLIGGAFTADVLAAIPGWWPALLAAVAFVPSAHALGYLVYRRVGGHPPATAYFAAMPGGLIEAIELARDKGADVATVAALQFARIAVVVTALPLLFMAAAGRPLGSAAGAQVAAAPLGPVDALILTAAGAAGFFAARRLRLPAGQILGPIFASAAVHGAGLTAAAPPPWLVALAQLVIGVSLGMRFRGFSRDALLGLLGCSALAVGAMLALGAIIAAGLARAGVAPFPVGMLSLAPGGVVEMGLIALSLQASPIFVTACHLARIVTAVFVGVSAWRILARD
jgi:membrane AbrB-like protein